MSVKPQPANLADAGEPRPRPGRRAVFAGTFSAVAAAHLLVLVRLPASAQLMPLAIEPPVLSVDLAPLAAPPGSSPAESAPPTPAASQQAAPPAAAPEPPASPPVPAAKPDINSLIPPPLDLTAEPIQLAPSPRVSNTPAADTAATPVSNTGATCDLTATLQAALQANEAVRNDLAAIPRGSRSVANAVQLWNGAWVDARGIGGDAVVGPIRAAIVAVVDQAPADCHDAPVAGPRLLTITDPRGTVIVAIGSDIWRWSDLSTPAPRQALP